MDGDLIRGLPDELALECLISVPYSSFSTVRSVCKAWRQELDSPYFHTFRGARGLAQPLIILAQAEKPIAASGPAKKFSASAPTYHLTIYEPATGSWSSLPSIPYLHHGLPLFCQIASVGRKLIVVGGWDSETWTVTDVVYIYDFTTGVWRCGAKMPAPCRSFFGCAAGMADGRAVVLVAGGHDEEKNALRSALIYDVVSDEWVALPDMACERDECQCIFSRGRFHVIGGYPTEMQGQFTMSTEVLNLATSNWGFMKDYVTQCRTILPLRACVAGAEETVYVCAAGQLVALGGDTWRTAVELPADVRLAPQLVGCEGSVMVIGSTSHGVAQSVYFVKLGREELTWTKVVVPEENSGHVQTVCCVQI